MSAIMDWITPFSESQLKFMTRENSKVVGDTRISPDIIDRFDAAPLKGEMNLGELPRKRRPGPWE